MRSETIIGAVIAAGILFISSLVTLFTNDPALEFGDLKTATWVSLVGGALVAFGKDFQALSVRRGLEAWTGSGNVHAPAWTALLAVIIGSSMLAGCVGTTAAYKAADGLEETAYVMNQHFLALVREGNELRRTGVLSGSALTTTQGLVETGRPILRELSHAAQLYQAVRSAANQDELTVAIAAAAVQLSKLLNAIRAAGGSAELLDDIELDLEPHLLAAA